MFGLIEELVFLPGVCELLDSQVRGWFFFLKHFDTFLTAYFSTLLFFPFFLYFFWGLKYDRIKESGFKF